MRREQKGPLGAKIQLANEEDLTLIVNANSRLERPPGLERNEGLKLPDGIDGPWAADSCCAKADMARRISTRLG